MMSYEEFIGPLLSRDYRNENGVRMVWFDGDEMDEDEPAVLLDTRTDVILIVPKRFVEKILAIEPWTVRRS